MYKFTLSVDSTCDLYYDFVVENDLKFVPLTFSMEKDGKIEERLDHFKTYEEYVAFYDELRAGGFSRTAMLNYESHFEHFKKLAQEGAEDVLHFTISSGLARTHEVAKQAAADVKKEFPKFNVLVVDPLTTTVGCGGLVRLALKCRNEGKGIQETYDYINSLRLHIQHYIVADDLQYLKKGGRVSAAAAAIGGVLGIKPIISFDNEGKLFVRDKVRGTKKAISYIKEKLEKEGPDELNYVFVVHTGNEPVANELADSVRNKFH
ncbi:MAG: DegV family protein, partial [Clostridiales bacterium]|nr:DegV family protein [Clostridiales bacterium]